MTGWPSFVVQAKGRMAKIILSLFFGNAHLQFPFDYAASAGFEAVCKKGTYFPLE
jgi:hypothetical protein